MVFIGGHRKYRENSRESNSGTFNVFCQVEEEEQSRETEEPVSSE